MTGMLGRKMRGVTVALTAALAVVAGAGGASADGGTTMLPSGAEAALHDVMVDADTQALRLRFVVPQLGEDYGADPDSVLADMIALCEKHGTALRAEHGADWQGVIITLMAKPVEFGAMDPDTVQFFDAFTVENGRCIWDEF